MQVALPLPRGMSGAVRVAQPSGYKACRISPPKTNTKI